MAFYVSRDEFLRWLHLFVLALGLAAGNFTLERFIPGKINPDHIAQVRYLCLPVLLFLAFLRGRFHLYVCGHMKEAAASLAILGVFVAYAACLVPAAQGFLQFYDPLESYFLVFMYGLCAFFALREKRDAQIFLIITFAIMIGILALYMAAELVWGPHYLATGYYYSRLFYIGFTLALIGLFHGLDKSDKGLAIAMAAVAFLFLYAGISTAMRASVLLYSLSLLACIPLMMALRQYRRLGMILLIAAVAYAAGLYQSGAQIAEKHKIYSSYVSPESPSAPVPMAESAPAVPAVSIPAPVIAEKTPCQRRIDSFVETTKQQVRENQYTCVLNVPIRDYDSRLRLALTGLENVKSLWFGNGPGTYGFLDAARPDAAVYYTYPHNIYIGLYNETGLIGLGLVGLSILLVIGVCIGAFFSHNPTTIGIFSLIPAFFLLSGLIADDLYGVRYVWIAPFVLTALIAGSRRSDAAV